MQKGDKIKTKLIIANNTYEIIGTVKDTRTVYGRSEILVSNGKIEPFWTTKAEAIVEPISPLNALGEDKPVEMIQDTSSTEKTP